MRNFAIAFVVFALMLGSAVADDTLETGRQYARWFQDGDTEALFGKFSPQMADGLPRDKLGEFQAQVSQQLGSETRVVDERVSQVEGFQVYTRISEFANAPGRVFDTQFALNDAGIIHGFFIRPSDSAPGKYDEYQTKTDLRVPFDEDWLVFWGGRTVEQNYHRPYPSQRFAYDILVVKDGKTHRGDGKRNEDYYCFGKQVFAPGDGVVARAVGDTPDREPGVMIKEQPFGNHIVIDHGNGEYSHMAHFRQGSVVVTEGQEISQGDLLGECGNSGHSSEAHLHYHLQENDVAFGGNGMPAQFQNYIADGVKVERGEPAKGQVIRNAD